MNENNSGIMTKIWGPPGWVFLHCVVMGYPSKIDKKDKTHIKRMKETRNFFESMAYILPCRYCRESYQQYIKELPIKKHLRTRKKLAKWLYDIHNKVNKKLDVISFLTKLFNKTKAFFLDLADVKTLSIPLNI